jgi:hypothetical protein
MEVYSRTTKALGALAGSFASMAVFWLLIDSLEWAFHPFPVARAPVIISFAAGAVLLALIAAYSSKGARADAQAARDLFAQRLATEATKYIEAVTNGRPFKPFVLYLRPFTFDTAFSQPLQPLRALVAESFFQHPPRFRFDYMLHEQLALRDTPLISIGVSDHVASAGHVVASDEEWLQRFRELAGLARSIAFVPGRQAGIVAEFRWLRVTGLLGNTVFLKPEGYPMREWQEVQRFFQEEEDVELPAYSPRRLAFRMYADGRCHDIIEWKNLWVPELANRAGKRLTMLLLRGANA